MAVENLVHQRPRYGHVLIIGQNPAKDGLGKSQSILRLERWMDVVGVDRWSFSNVWPEPGSIRGRKPDLDRLRALCYGHRRVVALGRVASQALERAEVQHFPLPHPSGLNRQLNDPAYVNAVLEDLRFFLA